jgi:hypothetical protein
MTSALQRERLDSRLGRLTDEPLPLGLDWKNDWPSTKRLSLSKRSSRAMVRFLITSVPLRFLIAICIGVAGTLAWQSYGDVVRQMMANSSPVLGWLAPQPAPFVQVASQQVTPAERATPSPDLQQLKAMSPDLAAVRQSVDELAAKLQQMAGDMATMQAAQQAILRKVATPSPPSPRQAAAPARNAVQN